MSNNDEILIKKSLYEAWENDVFSNMI
jgi:hypothetical protein